MCRKGIHYTKRALFQGSNPMTGRFAVSKTVLEWAIERSGIDMELLAKDAQLKKLPKWIAGEEKPTIKQIEKLASKTRTPFGFFFLPSPPAIKLPIPLYRTESDFDAPQKPSPELIDTVFSMQERQDWMREHMIEEDIPPLEYVGSQSLDAKVADVAAQMRRILKFNLNWAESEKSWEGALLALREAMGDAGILVVCNGIVGNNTRRSLNVEEFRGFVLVDKYAPLVFINNTDFKSAQMFTLAHELAHIMFGKSAAFDLQGFEPANVHIEKKCNQVAAEFLVPEVELRIAWADLEERDDPYESLARRFKVSQIVVARRLLDAGIIDKKRFFSFYNAYCNIERTKKAKRSDGGNFFNNCNVRIGSRFGSTVIRAVSDGKLLYTEAYRLLGIKGRTFKNYAAELGFKV